MALYINALEIQDVMLQHTMTFKCNCVLLIFKQAPHIRVMVR